MIDTQTAFEDYREALDQCAALAQERAFYRIENDADAGKLLRLDVQYMRATLNCERKRAEWVKARDARLDGESLDD